MQDRHYKVWPKGRPFELSPLKTSIYQNLVISAGRYPDHPAIVFYDHPIKYRALLTDVASLTAFLQSELGVKRNDRVLLCMQNCPQFIISYYGILGAAELPPRNRSGMVVWGGAGVASTIQVCGTASKSVV